MTLTQRQLGSEPCGRRRNPDRRSRRPTTRRAISICRSPASTAASSPSAAAKPFSYRNGREHHDHAGAARRADRSGRGHRHHQRACTQHQHGPVPSTRRAGSRPTRLRRSPSTAPTRSTSPAPRSLTGRGRDRHQCRLCRRAPSSTPMSRSTCSARITAQTLNVQTGGGDDDIEFSPAVLAADTTIDSGAGDDLIHVYGMPEPRRPVPTTSSGSGNSPTPSISTGRTAPTPTSSMPPPTPTTSSTSTTAARSTVRQQHR